jgi:hypothetical protein
MQRLEGGKNPEPCSWIREPSGVVQVCGMNTGEDGKVGWAELRDEG